MYKCRGDVMNGDQIMISEEIHMKDVDNNIKYQFDDQFYNSLNVYEPSDFRRSSRNEQEFFYLGKFKI